MRDVRFGVDMGGVLNKHNNDLLGDSTCWHLMTESEAPGAMEILSEIVCFIGADNVFIISRLYHGCTVL